MCSKTVRRMLQAARDRHVDCVSLSQAEQWSHTVSWHRLELTQTPSESSSLFRVRSCQSDGEGFLPLRPGGVYQSVCGVPWERPHTRTAWRKVARVSGDATEQPPPTERGAGHPWRGGLRNYLSFCRTVWNRSLFLAQPTYWHVRLTSENAQNSSWGWFLSLPNLLQNQSLDSILICNVVLSFRYDNIVCIHLCDECKRSHVPNVRHKILSILWSQEQVCSLTIKMSGLPIRAKCKHFRTIC